MKRKRTGLRIFIHAMQTFEHLQTNLIMFRKIIYRLKYFLFALVIFLSPPVLSQTDSPLFTNEPQYYIDSIRVSSLGIFDPDKIESISVVKEKDPSAPNGKVYIKIKKTDVLNLLTVGDIIRINKIPSGSISLFLLDNEVIKDTTNFRIDSYYILKVETIKASEIKYLPKNISKFEILKIFTATKANINEENKIYLRGK